MSEQKSDGILTPSAIEQVRKEHPDAEWIAVKTAAGPAAFKCPNEGEFARYQAMSDTNRASANRTILDQCLVYPKFEEWQAMVRRRPAIVVTASNELLRFAGYEVEATVKKYEIGSA